MKISDLTKAGCYVSILLADIHAILDERKTPEELINARCLYYQEVLTKILIILDTNMNLIKFIR
jgi:tyrosyl-tRNA synthetase